ncbi:hypothetical protein [Mucilaginibacter sp.]
MRTGCNHSTAAKAFNTTSATARAFYATASVPLVANRQILNKQDSAIANP